MNREAVRRGRTILTGLALLAVAGPALAQAGGPDPLSARADGEEQATYFLEVLAPVDDVPRDNAETLVPDSATASLASPLLARAGLLERLNQYKSVIHIGGVFERRAQLVVCLVGDDAATFLEMADYAREWQSAETWFTFSFTDGNNRARRCSGKRDEDIRVRFGSGGSWSRIGRIDAGASAETMNIDLGTIDAGSDFGWVVRHEFGHALGLRHEHQNPAASCDDEIDWRYKANDYLQKKYRIDSAGIVAQFRRLVAEGHDFSPYDRFSVMNYPLPPEIFKSPPSRGGPVSECINPRRTRISPGDLAGIAEYYHRDPLVVQAAAQRAFAELQQDIEASPLAAYDKAALIGLLAVSYPGLDPFEKSRLLDFRRQYAEYAAQAGEP